jgi:hypothetical protein
MEKGGVRYQRGLEAVKPILSKEMIVYRVRNLEEEKAHENGK